MMNDGEDASATGEAATVVSTQSFGGGSGWAAHTQAAAAAGGGAPTVGSPQPSAFVPPDPYGPPRPLSSPSSPFGGANHDEPLLDDDGYYHDEHAHHRGEHNSHRLSQDSSLLGGGVGGAGGILGGGNLLDDGLEEAESDGAVTEVSGGAHSSGRSAAGRELFETVTLKSPSNHNSPYNSDRDEWKRAAAGTFTTFRLSQEDVFGRTGVDKGAAGAAAGAVQRQAAAPNGGGGGRKGQRGGRQQRRSSFEGPALIPKNLRRTGSSLDDYFRNDGDDSVSIWGDVKRQLRCCDGRMGKFHKICLVAIAATAGMVAFVGGALPRGFGGGAAATAAEEGGGGAAAAGGLLLRPNAAEISGAVHPPTSSSSSSQLARLGSPAYSSSNDEDLRRSLASYADLTEPYLGSEVETPVFWHIPRSGGETASRVLGLCLGMVGAGRFGERAVRAKGSTLQVNTNGDGVRYVNVDTSNPEGIQRAQELRLVDSGLADFVVTSHVHDASALFDPASSSGQRRGRILALFRHPVKRIVSSYFHRSKTEPQVAALSMSAYATSDLSGEDNPIIRSILTLTPQALVSTRHVSEAKAILSSKVLVGITEFMDESLVRWEQYLRKWDDLRGDVDGLRCQQTRLAEGDQRVSSHPHFDPGTEEFQKLSVRHWADVELYHHAKQLFREQAGLVASDAAGEGQISEG